MHLGKHAILDDLFLQRSDLIGVRDEQRSLIGVVVIQHMHYLHGRIRLPRPRRSDHHRQALLNPRHDRTNLSIG